MKCNCFDSHFTTNYKEISLASLAGSESNQLFFSLFNPRGGSERIITHLCGSGNASVKNTDFSEGRGCSCNFSIFKKLDSRLCGNKVLHLNSMSCYVIISHYIFKVCTILVGNIILILLTKSHRGPSAKVRIMCTDGS